MNKKEKIKKLVEHYEEATSNKVGINKFVEYDVKNKEFYFEIDGEKIILSRNDLADDKGDNLAFKIVDWAQHNKE